MALAESVPARGNYTDSSHTDELSRALTTSPFLFLQPTVALQQAALEAAKTILDPLATEIAAAQIARRNESRRKRKRGSDEVEEPVLQIRQIYTKDLGVKQVWEQAKRVLEAACDEVEREIQLHRIDEEGFNGTDEEEIESNDEDDDLNNNDNLSEDNEHSGDVSVDGEIYAAEDVESGEDVENIEDDSDVMGSSDAEGEEGSRPQEAFVQDPNNLNDGFFSIDDFNKQSQFLEHMDAQGEVDERSDEDEIDWTVDPLSQNFAKPPPGREQSQNGPDEDEDTEDAEDGPIFGNANLNDMDSDEDLDEINDGDLAGEMMGLANTNDVRYADFFEPPPKKPSKNKRMRALPKTQPPPTGEFTMQAAEKNAENDLERAMADVRRDLLDSDEGISDEEESDDSSEGNDKSARKSRIDKNLSTHEKQKAEIAQEIRRLEAANVARKDWTLSGEASGHARPLNSLLDEGGNLEFERAGKPVPVITAEVSEDMEALIKRRILAREFDEVVRRRPTAIGDAADTRRGRVEVDDTKPSASLGEIYEQEHLRQSDPSAYVDKLSAATKKQHEEIDRLWKDVREQLDVLGNLHFKPKRLNVEIKTVEDKPRIAMEDARPTAVDGDIDGSGLLAPQEVYKPGTEGRPTNGEVVVDKTGASRSKEEMTREEKLRRRRREKARLKKAQGNKALIHLGGEKNSRKGKKIDQQNILDDLKRGGVKVIGKGGEMQDLSGKKKRKDRAQDQTTEIGKVGGSSSALKL